MHLFVFFWMLFFCASSKAESLFDRRTPDGRYVFGVIRDQGISEEALYLLFRMYDFNEGLIPNTDTAMLVDYSKTSVHKRLYLLNLRTAGVEQYLVSHGVRSGVLESRAFSNIAESWRSSLGFYITKGTFQSSKNGLSLSLEGLDKSNSNARSRGIVLHGASYVSEAFIKKNGRLGWSEGCFAVEIRFVKKIVNSLKAGSLIFSYHTDLMSYSRKYPLRQLLPSEEVVPPNVNKRRTAGEGGGVSLVQSELP